MTDETFVRTSPPLNRVVVKVGGGPAPWEALRANTARTIARDIEGRGWPIWAEILREYADAVDAMTQPPALEVTTE